MPEAQQDFFGRRYDATGSPVGGEFEINPTTEGAASLVSHFAVADLVDGSFVVARTEYDPMGDCSGVFAQVYDAFNNPVGPEIRVETTIVPRNLSTSVVGFGDGGFTVFWESDPSTGLSSSILGQRFHSDGSTVRNEFSVHIHEGGGGLPSFEIAELNSGGFVAVWIEPRTDVSGQYYSDVIRRVYNADGSAAGGGLSDSPSD
ncbi:hypothetical protein OEZ49_22975 [Ruegeria sp. WL0004]|uniref:Uncharacterized protein n=1 Tax=Ruegeria marisflavi TaxID=2984152 RepID=A0ABT2WXH4_9RHOB|nr:hypothetical protein [Ruegeria sp. WL0004]